MKRNIISFLCMLLVPVFALSAFGNSERSRDGTRTITDVTGRRVRIPNQVERIITLGPGAPRIAAYLGVIPMHVGAERYNTENMTVVRDYNPVHFEFFRTLPLVGSGGGSGNNNAFPEEIILLNPDLIIAAYTREAADELQRQTGIPVVSIEHDTGLAPASFYAAVRVFADAVGVQARGETILAYMDNMLADLNRRTADIPAAQRQGAYAGAVTWNGRRGIAGTYSVFGIFDAINARNVAYDPSIPGFYEASLESLVIWDPDVIFLDPGNMDLVNEEYQTNPAFFNSLRAVREGRVYTMPAFNFANTNTTYAFINAYYAGIVLFPQQFSDINIADKAAEILRTFLGVNTYQTMAQGGLYYGTITIGR
ncbi:MAG: ABC transporter substrate-binding protein [Treponema sp.]|nr:ABC transporter substrate-binding protein [Treponema sp.]